MKRIFLQKQIQTLQIQRKHRNRSTVAGSFSYLNQHTVRQSRVFNGIDIYRRYRPITIPCKAYLLLLESVAKPTLSFTPHLGVSINCKVSSSSRPKMKRKKTTNIINNIKEVKYLQGTYTFNTIASLFCYLFRVSISNKIFSAISYRVFCNQFIRNPYLR